MESNEARRELLEVDRLAAATRVEATGAAAWAWPVMVVAMVGFFASFGILHGAWRGLASATWSLFVAGWIFAIRRGNRATPRPIKRSAEQRRHDTIEWIVLLVVANGLTLVLSRVSWALVGLALAAMGTGYGALSAMRANRS